VGSGRSGTREAGNEKDLAVLIAARKRPGAKGEERFRTLQKVEPEPRGRGKKKSTKKERKKKKNTIN